MLKYIPNFKNTVFQYRKNILYYLLLSGLMFLLLRPGVHVASPIRIGLMFLALLPAFSRPEYLPFCMTCIVGISSNAFYDILPTSPGYYLIIILLLYVNYKKRSGFFLNAFGIYSVFLLFSLAHGDFPVFLTWGLIAVILADFIKTRSDFGNLVIAFMIASFIPSLLFLMYQDFFNVDYGSMDEGLQRAYWMNTNRFGAAIAAGGVMAVAYISGLLNVTRTESLRILSIITIVLAIPTLVLNASRGAIFAFIIPSLIVFLLSEVKTVYKLTSFAIIALVLYHLYARTDMFELLIARMQDDTFETGGDRTTIWENKLSKFLEYDFATQFVGIGRSACVRLAGYMSTHNDFLTAFIGYGYFGLFLFSILIAFPFIKAPKRSKKAVFVLSLYIVIECFVLEPIFRGYLFFLMFYIFTLKYALLERKKYKKELAVRNSLRSNKY